METLYGSLFIGIPAILVAFLLFWRNYKPIFWMITGALALGLGYLGMTGATRDIGEPIAEAIHGTTSSMATQKTKPDTKVKRTSNASSGAIKSVGSPPGRYVTP